MELFRGIDIDWLGKKWYFLAFSLIFSVAGVLSLLFWHGIKLGIDFRGGTLVYVQFAQPPNVDRIREAIDRAEELKLAGPGPLPPTIRGVSILGAAGYFAALFLGFRVLWAITWDRRKDD